MQNYASCTGGHCHILGWIGLLFFSIPRYTDVLFWKGRQEVAFPWLCERKGVHVHKYVCETGVVGW